MRAPLVERHQFPTGILNRVYDGLRDLGTAAVDVGRRQMIVLLPACESSLSPTLTFSAASAKVKFQGRPVARLENRRWLLRVGSGQPGF